MRTPLPAALPGHNARRYRYIQRVFGAKLRYLDGAIAPLQGFFAHAVHFIAKNEGVCLSDLGQKIVGHNRTAGLFNSPNGHLLCF